MSLRTPNRKGARLRTVPRRRRAPLTASLVRLLAAFLLLLAGCADPESEIAETVYGDDAGVTCAPGSRPGAAGRTDGEETEKGFRYNVRTPANYDPTVAHPLLVVYAPAGRSASRSERYVGLTRVATGAGFVVAYAESRRMEIPNVEELGTIPGRVAEKWCVDKERIFFTGHSDGGTVSTALAVLEKTRGAAAAIAPSAAGFAKEAFDEYTCPDPLSVMVMHNAGDALFPGFGAEAARWWAKCNRCEATPEPAEEGCLAYPNCASGVRTLYCEGEGGHSRWPERNAALIDFLASAGGS